jgi:hypothetical protein
LRVKVVVGTEDLVCEVDELCVVIRRVDWVYFCVEESPYAGHKVGRRVTGERAQSGGNDESLEVVLDVEELRGREKELRRELGFIMWGRLADYRDVGGQGAQKAENPGLVIGGDPGGPCSFDGGSSVPCIEDEVALAFLEIVGEDTVELRLRH